MVLFRLGAAFDRNNMKDSRLDWIALLPSWLVPEKLMTLAFLDKFYKILRYGMYSIYNFFEC